MKKDIEVPVVEGVHIAAVLEKHEEFHTDDWNIYLVNTNDHPIEMVIISSKGYGKLDGKEVKTSVLRHSFPKIEAKDSMKVEPILGDALKLYNEFWVSYYHEGRMYDEKFIFRPNTINDKAQRDIPVINKRGVLA